ncbi:TPA: type II toxin-antitoxin system RelE/ParE family toxin [Escherichia coli]
MRLEWKPMSLSDREQIMEYISKDNPLAAIALDNQFEAIAEQACERPEMYRAGRVAGTHEAVVRPHYVLGKNISSFLKSPVYQSFNMKKQSL